MKQGRPFQLTEPKDDLDIKLIRKKKWALSTVGLLNQSPSKRKGKNLIT